MYQIQVKYSDLQGKFVRVLQLSLKLEVYDTPGCFEMGAVVLNDTEEYKIPLWVLLKSRLVKPSELARLRQKKTPGWVRVLHSLRSLFS